MKLAEDSLRRADTSPEEEKTLATDFVLASVQPRNAGLDGAKPAGAGAQLHTLEVRIANLRKENETLKRGRDGQRVGGWETKKPDLTIPVCPNPKCGRRHKGKCILDRDLEAEQKALDFAIKMRGKMKGETTAGAEQRAMARANTVSFEDVNESDDTYNNLTCLPWNQDAAQSDEPLIHYSTFLHIQRERGACVDSGSPVDITFNEEYAECTTGKDC